MAFKIIFITVYYMYNTLVFGVIILLIDLPWIYNYMAPLYKTLFKKLNMTLQGNVIGAILAYSAMILSFPLLIEDKNKNIMLKRAAALGFTIYGTYAFTLHTIMPKYDMKIALTETIWGTLLYLVATKLTIMFTN